MIRNTVILLLSLIILGCNKNNPVSIETGTIDGLVTKSDGTVVVMAEVTTTPVTSSNTTDSCGRYTFYNIKPGSYVVTSKKSGFINTSISVTVRSGIRTVANIIMTYDSTTIEWVNIPAGIFTMGSTASDTTTWPNTSNEYPQHAVYLDAFEISKFEITNAQYKTFIDAGGYTNSSLWTSDGWTWLLSNGISEPLYWISGQYNGGVQFPNHPVAGVSWYEADAFCHWVGGHLPTEAQWEKAARGVESSNYWPWGSVWDGAKCNSNENMAPDTFTYSSPVGFFSNGVSDYKIIDMAGNIGEWCSDWYLDYYYSISPSNNPLGPPNGVYRLLRGGNYNSFSSVCRVTSRSGGMPTFRYFLNGFRVVK